MAATVFERLESLLSGSGVAFDVLRHAPVYTSAEAAAVRGTPLASGAKALVCKCGDEFQLLVLPADRKLSSKLARAALGAKNLRFASPQEVLTLTGLTPGAIPPFGQLFGLPTWCDRALAENERINFNAGDHAISISMRFDDFVRVERPALDQFSDQADTGPPGQL
jgi:prolyl-tRNA editing enzyme YbaK/EbsC (Cys-tRNA(Pro) deacylase)